jgi:hypothetical protein
VLDITENFTLFTLDEMWLNDHMAIAHQTFSRLTARVSSEKKPRIHP